MQNNNLIPQFSKKLTNKRSGRFLVISWVTIILLIPFHGFLSVWLSSIFGGYLALRSWKEALIILMLLAGLLFLYKNDQKLFLKLAKRPINRLIVLYVFLHLVLSAASGINLEAVLYALVYNLRFLGIFLMAQVLGHYLVRSSAKHHLPSANDIRLAKLVLWPAGIVIAFALLQALVLPNDFLSNLGYGPDTIDPYVTIDAKDDWVRAQSTLRGPNQLGQYLLLPILLMASLWLKKPDWRKLGGLIAGGLAMVFSFSRSAWLGLAAGVSALLTADREWLKWRKQILSILIGLAVLSGSLFYAFSGSDAFKLVVFHDDQAPGDVADSNTIRINATQKSLKLVAEEPVGHGPGFAGPASFHNDIDTKINENYYLQIALEVGVVGLLVFLSINWLLAVSLWRQRTELWPRVLFACFVGLFLVSFFLPAWANDEALIFWGLAGLFYRN